MSKVAETIDWDSAPSEDAVWIVDNNGVWISGWYDECAMLGIYTSTSSDATFSVESKSIAVHERPTSRIDVIGQNGNDGEHYDISPEQAEDNREELRELIDEGKKSAYHRKVKGVWIDFYDIAQAFDPENRNSADDHALKKMLLPGKRHTKDGIQDRKEAIQSIERAIELEGEE